jgi:hypothetical protein
MSRGALASALNAYCALAAESAVMCGDALAMWAYATFEAMATWADKCPAMA